MKLLWPIGHWQIQHTKRSERCMCFGACSVAMTGPPRPPDMNELAVHWSHTALRLPVSYHKAILRQPASPALSLARHRGQPSRDKPYWTPSQDDCVIRCTATDGCSLKPPYVRGSWWICLSLYQYFVVSIASPGFKPHQGWYQMHANDFLF